MPWRMVCLFTNIPALAKRSFVAIQRAFTTHDVDLGIIRMVLYALSMSPDCPMRREPEEDHRQEIFLKSIAGSCRLCYSSQQHDQGAALRQAKMSIGGSQDDPSYSTFGLPLGPLFSSIPPISLIVHNRRIVGKGIPHHVIPKIVHSGLLI